MILLCPQSILSSPASWDVLSKEEKEEILALLPDQQHILISDNGVPELNFVTLRNDDNFRRDCAAYTEHLAQGRYDPQWLAEAWAAHERRKAGDFDDYLIDELESTWEIKLPDQFKARRMASINAAGATSGGRKPPNQSRGAKTVIAASDEPSDATEVSEKKSSPAEDRSGSKGEAASKDIVCDAKMTDVVEDELSKPAEDSITVSVGNAKRTRRGKRTRKIASVSEDELA